MRVLYISSSFPSNGSIGGAWIPDTIQTFTRNNIEVIVLTQNNQSNRLLIKHSDNYQIYFFGWAGKDKPLINLMSNPITNLYLIVQYFYKALKAGNKICKELKPDIIHAEWTFPAGYIAKSLSKKYKIPYSVRSLGSDIYKLNKFAITKYLNLKIYKQANLISANSYTLVKEIEEFTKRQTHLLTTSRRLGDKKTGFKINNKDGQFIALVIGRLDLVKGQDILIAAASRLLKQGFPFQLHLIGSGPQKNNYAKLIKNLGLNDHVFLAGRLEDGDVKYALDISDCLIIPSRSESFPLVFIEAIEHNTPVICSDVGDMPYIMNKYKLGEVFNSGNVTNLVEKINLFHSTISNNDYLNNKEAFLSQFNIQASAYNFIKLLKSTIEENRSRN